MRDPLISVIVPVYNTEQYLDECIASIINQTYKNLEIILVDDGSTDRCPEMCDEWARKDQRIKVIHQKNAGAAAARNAALEIASGSYIGFVDSDDYIAQNMFEQLLTAVTNTERGISFCYYNRLMTDGRIQQMDASEKRKTLDATEAVSAMLCERINTGMCSKLFARYLFEGIRFREGETNEEFPVLIPLIVKADGMAIVDNALYYYRVRQGSVTSVWFLEKANAGVVRKNLGIMSEQLAEYNLACNKEYRFFVASCAYRNALSMEKNYERLSRSVLNDYAAYRELLKENLAFFLLSEYASLKDKILCVLVLTKLLRPLYKVFYRDHL